MKIPWDIKKEDFPQTSVLADQIKFVLGYAILAPSTHNSQPWRFKIQDNFCRIYYNPELKLPEADPSGRDLYISMGCMIENLIIAANYFGIFWDFRPALKDNLIGEIFFKEIGEKNIDLKYLLETIPKRINARGMFENKKLPAEIEAELMSLKKDGRIKTDFITDKEKISKIAGLTAKGLRIAYKKPSFRKEMASWMRNSLSGSKTGLPGYSLRIPLPLSFLIPTLVKFLDLSPVLAKLNYKSMSSAPFICLFSSEDSNPEIWFETGRLAERFMLQLGSKK